MSDQDLAIIDQALSAQSEKPSEQKPSEQKPEEEPGALETFDVTRQTAEQSTSEGGFLHAVGDSASVLPRAAGDLLARIPTPTSLLFPLVILLVFFFLLIPVNGQTRAVWLWLVLTGNARIGQGSGGGQSTAEIPVVGQVIQFPLSHVEG